VTGEECPHPALILSRVSGQCLDVTHTRWFPRLDTDAVLGRYVQQQLCVARLYDPITAAMDHTQSTTCRSPNSVEGNPASGVTMQKEEVKAKDVLDDDEFERLLVELPDYSRRIVLAAAETGMRSSEIRRLKWEDVDMVAGELRVGVAKNKEFQVVSLTQRLFAMLEDMKLEATPHPTAPVFEGVEIKKGLAAALKRAGIEKHISLHSFRHQFATRALEAGVSSFHLQAIGGWKSPVMLQRYGKVRNKALHEQMAKLNANAAIG